MQISMWSSGTPAPSIHSGSNGLQRLKITRFSRRRLVRVIGSIFSGERARFNFSRSKSPWVIGGGDRGRLETRRDWRAQLLRAAHTG